MSFEHLDDESRTLTEGTGFTQISNFVINNIRNGDAYLVWSYLFSKTSSWKTIKQNIKNVYGFGDKKLEKIFSYLNRAHLIKYVQTKSANGKYAHVQIKVLNGLKFDKTQAYIECAPQPPKMGAAEMGCNPNDELLNKEDTKERKEHNTKNNSATDVAPARNDITFDEFWKAYPIKKNKIRSKRIWDKENFAAIVTLICCDVMTRTKDDSQWQDKRYIPHPATYLGNKLWEDEIIQGSPPKKSGGKSSSFDEYLKNQNKQGETYDQYGNSY